MMVLLHTPGVFTHTEFNHQGYAFKLRIVSLGSNQPTEKLKARKVGMDQSFNLYFGFWR
jgi:hypothetical protein